MNTATGLDNLPACDVLIGGFPCQDLSVAGRGAGLKEGTRSGLFFEMWRIALELEPRFVVFENVPMIRRRGLDVVASVIASDGWTLEWRQLSAADCGARHLRNRWFAIAHREDELVMHENCAHIGDLLHGTWATLQDSLFGWRETVEEMPVHGYVREGKLYMEDVAPRKDMSGLWPTPSSSFLDTDLEVWHQRKVRVKQETGANNGMTLDVAARLWPTPRAQEPGVTTKGYGRGLAELVEGKEQRWATPTSSMAETTHFIATGLREAARLHPQGRYTLWTQVCDRLPTPNSRDYKDTYSSQEALDNREAHQESLAVRAQKMAGHPGRLNPDWVDLLMGFPLGYSLPEGESMHKLLDPACWYDGSWESGVSRLTEVTENRVKRLKALGNSVVPHQAYVIGLYLAGR